MLTNIVCTKITIADSLVCQDILYKTYANLSMNAAKLGKKYLALKKTKSSKVRQEGGKWGDLTQKHEPGKIWEIEFTL